MSFVLPDILTRPGRWALAGTPEGQDARLLVLIQGDENMSDKIEMPRGIGAEVQQKHGDKVMELLAGINMRFQGEDTEEFSPARMQARVARFADLKPQAAAGKETVYPIMSPEAEGRAAPVQCWPGLNVAMMIAEPGQSNTATIAQDKRQWVINIGDSECEVSWGNERLTLGRYDMVCPSVTADDLTRAWPEADYVIVPDAGHSAMEPGIRAALVTAMEKLKRV